jgi:peptidoglycan/LPS O-acetylase OafA/YrhL
LLRSHVARFPSWLGGALFVGGLVAGGKPFFTPATGTFYDAPYQLAARLHGEMYFWPAGAALVVIGAMASGSVSRALSHASARFLGRISFALYLVHFPLLVSLLTYLFVAFGRFSDTAFIAAVTVYFLALFPIATVFTLCIDEPSVRLCQYAKRRSRLTWANAAQRSVFANHSPGCSTKLASDSKLPAARGSNAVA